MISARLGQSWGSIAQATAVAAALCCGAATACRRTGRALAPVRHFCGCRHDRSKDGVFVFRDPKINADLSLVYEKVKIVRGMEGYGWFANTIFRDKDNDEKQYAVDFWLIGRPASSRSRT